MVGGIGVGFQGLSGLGVGSRGPAVGGFGAGFKGLVVGGLGVGFAVNPPISRFSGCLGIYGCLEPKAYQGWLGCLDGLLGAQGR